MERGKGEMDRGREREDGERGLTGVCQQAVSGAADRHQRSELEAV